MFIRFPTDFNGTPWAVKVTDDAITVTAQANELPGPDTTSKGSGDFYLAISGDLQPATNGEFHLATDTPAGRCSKTMNCSTHRTSR